MRDEPGPSTVIVRSRVSLEVVKPRRWAGARGAHAARRRTRTQLARRRAAALVVAERGEEHAPHRPASHLHRGDRAAARGSSKASLAFTISPCARYTVDDRELDPLLWPTTATRVSVVTARASRRGAQPAGARAVVRDVAREQAPEARRVVQHLEVADLVPDDVVEHRAGASSSRQLNDIAPLAEQLAQRVRWPRIVRPP